MPFKNGKKKKKEVKKPTTWYGKVWYFIWHDNSAASWLVNIILAYIIIKFLIYPGLGAVLGTNFPIVAVVSNSMEHHQNFDNWWVSNEDYYLGKNITRPMFEEYPFKNGFNKGDIMFLIGKKPDDIKLGDVIVFQTQKPYPIIHRVIAKENKSMWVFQTKGDNNKAQIREYYNPKTNEVKFYYPGDPIPSGYVVVLDETQVLEKQLLGRAVFRVPWLGYVKIWFVDILNFLGVYSVSNPAA